MLGRISQLLAEPRHEHGGQVSIQLLKLLHGQVKMYSLSSAAARQRADN